MEFKRVITGETLRKISRLLTEENGRTPTMDGIFFVALENGRLVGCVSIKRLAWWGTEVQHLLVLPDHRRKGVGKFLLANVFGRIGTPTVLATIVDGNKGSTHIFAGAGFKEAQAFANTETGHKVRLFTKGPDAIVPVEPTA